MLKLTRSKFTFEDNRPDPVRPPSSHTELGEAALPLPAFHWEETADSYRKKRKTALQEMFGPGNG